MNEKLIIYILFLAAFAVCGCDEESEYQEPKLQTSEYEWHGCMDEEYLSLCGVENDYVSSWKISCPKCSFAYIEQLEGCLKVANFYHDAYNQDYTMTYCRGCYYPLGTDWSIIKKIEKQDGVLDVLCSCGNSLFCEDGVEQFMYTCAKCGTVYTNTDYKTNAEYYSSVGMDWLND